MVKIVIQYKKQKNIPNSSDSFEDILKVILASNNTVSFVESLFAFKMSSNLFELVKSIYVIFLI